MRKNFGAKAWMFPEPVLMIGTYDENGNANLMNAAWGAMFDYDVVTVSLASHKTTENFFKTKAFTISFATKKTVIESDYFGIVSGKKVPNKVEVAGFHPFKSTFVNAPLFEEYPLSLECEFMSLDEDGRLLGKIVNVSADESILTDGKIDADKLEAIAFEPFNNNYLLVKGIVGKAFKDGLKIK